MLPTATDTWLKHHSSQASMDTHTWENLTTLINHHKVKISILNEIGTFHLKNLKMNLIHSKTQSTQNKINKPKIKIKKTLYWAQPTVMKTNCKEESSNCITQETEVLSTIPPCYC